MQILDCKPVAEAIRTRCLTEADALRAKGIIPKLAMIRVGEKGPDLSYEAGAKRTMQEAGIETEVIALDEYVSQEEYIARLKEANADPSIHGILPFLPLDHIDQKKILGTYLAPEKDVDASTPANMGKLVIEDPTGFFPCTAAAVMEVIDYYAEPIRAVRAKNDPYYDPGEPDVCTGLKVCVVNYSRLIGKPLSTLLTIRYAITSVLRSRLSEEERNAITAAADVLVTAVPHRNAVTADMVKPGAVIIDAATNWDTVLDENGDPVINEKTGKPRRGIFGCCTKEAIEKAAYYTPVPGLGAVTSAILCSNVIKACKQQEGLA